MIEIKNLVKRYKKETLALDHVSLKMRTGEILGILGPNGSGKTTLINCVLDLLRYEAGEITFENQKINDKIKQKIGIVPQDLALIEGLSVEENIDYFCGLYIKDSKLRKQYVQEAIDFVDLQMYRKKNVKKLSGGLKRRLNIACGIVHKPNLIFLDEPTVAIDPQSRNFILEGLKKLNKEGASIVYTTHYMEEAELICDRIAIMDIANILTIGSKKEIMEEMGIHVILKMEIKSEQFKLPDGIRQLGNNEYILENDKSLEILIEKLKYEKVDYSLLEVNQPTLNDIFLLLTGKALRDDL